MKKAKTTTNNYMPLPDCLTIKESSINGLGLFATDDIDKNTILGISHYFMNNDLIIRTPLGGFYNHSETPNTKRIKKDLHFNIYELCTINDIKKGNEILVKYQLYTL